VRAGRALSRGDSEDALGLLFAAAQAFEDAGDLRGMCLSLCNASYAAAELGLSSRAETLARDAIENATRWGISYVAYGARANLALAQIRGAKYEDAEKTADEVVAYAQERGDRFLSTGGLLYRSLASIGRGDMSAAEE